MKPEIIKIILILVFFHLPSIGLCVQDIDIQNQSEQTTIHELEFKGAQLGDVIRVLAEQSGINIIATHEATQANVNIYLKDITILEAVESICRINGLWYRQDKNGTIRIMTVDEYSKDLVIYRDDIVRVFKLLNPNVRIVAQAIEDLYGPRVELSLGLDPAQEQEFVEASAGFGSNSSSVNSRNSRNSSTRNRGSRTTGGNITRTSFEDKGAEVSSDLTVDQIESFASTDTRVSAESIQDFTSQSAIIYVTVNNEHNMIIVRTSDVDAVDSIAELIEQLDKPVPQVLLEMKVLDILVGDDFRSIANFGIGVGESDFVDPDTNAVLPTSSFLLGNFPVEGGTFIYEFISDRVRAVLDVLIQNNRINVLSKPIVLASNNRPAELFVGEETVITTGFSSDTVVNETSTTRFIEAETEIRSVGNRITITPFINADDSITLALVQETSSVNEDGASVLAPAGGGNVTELTIDTVNTANVAGTVVAKHGYTMAVGGLIRNTKNKNTQKVPVLGDIPLVGTLFRREEQGDEHRELVLLITPYVMRKGEEYADVTQKRFIEGSRYSEWSTEEVPPEFIKPRQELPSTIEQDLEIYDENKVKPGRSSSRDLIISDKPTNVSALPRQSEAVSLAAPAASHNPSENPVIRLIEDAVAVKKPEDAIRVSVDSDVPSALFFDRKLVAYPDFTWKKDDLYVTRVRVKNISSNETNLKPNDLRGSWLSASFDAETLLPNAETNGYLVSNQNFLKSLATTPGDRGVKQVIAR